MKDLKTGAKELKAMADAYKKLDKDVPRIAGIVAVKIMRENFAKGGWQEKKGSIDKWKARKAATNFAYDHYHNYKGSVYNSGNPVLRQSGNLRDSISYKLEGAHKVFIGSNLNLAPYAEAHTEGLNNQPKRKFIGWSEYLAESIHAELKKRRAAIFKNLKK